MSGQRWYPNIITSWLNPVTDFLENLGLLSVILVETLSICHKTNIFTDNVLAWRVVHPHITATLSVNVQVYMQPIFPKTLFTIAANLWKSSSLSAQVKSQIQIVKMQKHITCNTSNWMLCNFGKHCIPQFTETRSTSTCNAI